MKKFFGFLLSIVVIVLVLAGIVSFKLGLFDKAKNAANQIVGNGSDSSIKTSDMSKIDGDSQSFKAADVKELVLNCQYGTFSVEKTDKEDVVIEVNKNAEKVKYSLNEGVLTIATDSKPFFGDADEVNLTLYVPQTVIFTNADIDIGAGVMNVSNLVLSKMDINVGAGKITMDSVRASDVVYSLGAGEAVNTHSDFSSLDLEVGAGSFSFAGYIAHDMSLNCSVGRVKMELEAKYEDYNSDVTCNMGSVTLGTNIYSGVVDHNTVDNDSLYDISVKCDVGNVDISFTK